MCGMTTQTSHGWMPRDREFGMRLAMIRNVMQWNAKEAAAECGVPQASWRDWELGKTRPRDILTVAKKIAERTGVDYYWVLEGHPAPMGGPGRPLVSVTQGDKLPQLDSNQQPAG